MRILLTGATGFVGRRLAQSLIAAGHEVVGCARRRDRAFRRFPDLGWIKADFACDLQPSDWKPRLTGFDAVINASGILRERGRQRFDAVHLAGPRALFQACAEHGTKKIIQVSALGCDAPDARPYAASKRQLDDFIRTLDVDWTIVRPALIWGEQSPATSMLRQLARLPLVPLIGNGNQWLQPIHVDDVCAVVLAALEGRAPRSLVEVAGPHPVTMRRLIAGLRSQTAAGPARFLPVPLPLVRLAAKMSDLIGAGPFGIDTLEMLVRGNLTRDNSARRLLGREPVDIAEFVAAPGRMRGARISGTPGHA